MKKGIILIFIGLLTFESPAQILGDNPEIGNIGLNFTKKMRKADLYFQFFAYHDAANLYQQILSKQGATDTLRLKIAESYRKLNMQDSASSWYSKIEDNQVMEPIHYLYYGQALESSGNLAQAKVQYQNYYDLASTDSRAPLKIEGIENITDYYIDSALYTVSEISTNSPEADFGPSFFQEGFVFASARPRPALIRQKFKWNNKPYLDLYYTTVDNGAYSKPLGFSSEVNSKFHEGPVTFSPDGKRMIFTRNNFYESKTGVSDDGIVKLKLYSADVSSETGWTNIQELPFNSDQYSVGHPTLSRDGTKLYFVSDMTGGFGGTDIYVSTFDSTWSQPANLGDDINSEGDEMFPFLYDDKLLYFASNGYGGLGGLDIYKTWLLEDETSGVINLGYPVNTTKDDFGLILDEFGKSGYLSSNREGGTGDDDIYFMILNRIIVDAFLVDKETGEPIEEGILFALDKTTDRPAPILKERNMIQYDALPNREYEIKGSKEGYYDNTVMVPIGELEPGTERITVKVELTKIPLYPPLPPLDVASADILLIENISGKNQSFVLPGDSVYSYEGSETQLQTALAASNIEVGQVIRISNIYFDLDKWNIREDARTELDKLVALMAVYPQMKLAMDAHTDSRQTDNYNDVLSQKRARSTMNYLVRKGVSRDRLQRAHFGERKLVNDCGNDAQCTEAQHQFNRRTEFEIISY
ncbi:MAG: OmpA family protein [Cyclobacteriaceae bacterium]|nr:OmpA family protein [Cyclobacteriaceae bacterium]